MRQRSGSLVREVSPLSIGLLLPGGAISSPPSLRRPCKIALREFRRCCLSDTRSRFSQAIKMTSPEGFRSKFMEVLRLRRTEEVPLRVERASPVTDPNYQGSYLSPREAMESCPRNEVGDTKTAFEEENLYLFTEAGEQGKVPVLIMRLREKKVEKMPVVVILHSSYKTKEWVKPLLEAYASRGYVAVAIDSRYHGDRAKTLTCYQDALISAWKNGDTMPFLFDTVWDLIKLADYLNQREDVDPSRIGITGESLGGMHAWFAAAVDPRYSVVVPVIGVQGFGWALENHKWHARVDSIKPVFEEARLDLGKPSIDRDVVEKVWDRLAPGLCREFDAPYSVPLIAPRPLLILNGAEDCRCPCGGLEGPVSKAMDAYKDANSSQKFNFVAQPGIGHCMTTEMVKEASGWFDKFLW